jgi:hypothetical protein
MTMTIEKAKAYVNALKAQLAPLGLDSVVVLDGLNERDIRHFAEISREIMMERPKKVAALPPPAV